MEYVVLAVIVLVALGAMVAFVGGNIAGREWGWGTAVAAILLVMATTGYIYLAARLAQREQAWRTVVAGQQSKIDGLLGGAGGESLAALRDKRDRWTRALEFVDTWHGRSWKTGDFKPPRDGRAGEVSIPISGEAAVKTAPLEKGAEIAVFDDANIQDDGRFLGLFRVEAVKLNEGAETCQLTIVPDSFPTPPDASDAKLWARAYDAVTVYESIPVDRWLAFHKTPEELAGGPAPAGDSPARWMPQPRKTSAEDQLKGLESHMRALERHAETVPQEAWAELGEQLAQGKGVGRYWATVRFTKQARFSKKDRRFTAADGAAPAEAAAGDDDEGPVGTPGETIGEVVGAPATEDTPTPVSPDGEPTAGAVTNRFRTADFNVGDTAEFDLQTALSLQNESQLAEITAVVERRPLTDPLTAIRGGRFRTRDGKAVRSEGIDALRRALLVEMESITEATAKITAAQDSVTTQAAAVADETSQLKDDLGRWKKDVGAAEAIAGDFDDRLRAASVELAALETSIARLGRELDDHWAVLTEAIDAAAPRAGPLPR